MEESSSTMIEIAGEPFERSLAVDRAILMRHVISDQAQSFLSPLTLHSYAHAWLPQTIMSPAA